jgi:RimJ/RimL family protein N-acetyltransferase
MTDAVITTPRLALRRFVPDDAPFMLALLNDPGWIRFIGDRQVREVEPARAYLGERVIAQYDRLGFGLWLVARKADGEPMGMCGLVKRDSLDDVDIGFALLPLFRGQGYAFEAAEASLAYARDMLALPRVLAIAVPENTDSIRLLEKLGLRFERSMTSPVGEALNVYTTGSTPQG